MGGEDSGSTPDSPTIGVSYNANISPHERIYERSLNKIYAKRFCYPPPFISQKTTRASCKNPHLGCWWEIGKMWWDRTLSPPAVLEGDQRQLTKILSLNIKHMRQNLKVEIYSSVILSVIFLTHEHMWLGVIWEALAIFAFIIDIKNHEWPHPMAG